WAINEIAGNVLDYAESPGWIQAVTHSDRVVFCVCDAGVGVPVTMRRVFPSLQGDREALALAVKPGGRKSRRGQGNGLAGCMAIAKQSGGSFHLASGDASLYLHESGDQQVETNGHVHRGTCVNMTLPAFRPIDIEKALWGHKPVPQSELMYSST